MTRLVEVVATSEAVAATRSRTAKRDALAELLRRLEPDEIEPTVGFLVGAAVQGRIGVGWATLRDLDIEPAAEPSVTVLDVHRTIDGLAALTGPGSTAARSAELSDLFARLTAPEADFTRRLLLGEMRQGALAGVMTDAVAKAAGVGLAVMRQAAMFAGDLSRVAVVALTEGEPALAAIGLELFRPVLPMLAATATDVADAMAAGDGPYSVEWKLDGIRIQAHRVGEQVRLYTRNLNEVTERLPAVVAVVRSLPAHSLVLDGEVIGEGDDDADRPDLFQDTMSSFGRHAPGDHGVNLAMRFFDCLHVDGTDLVHRPLTERAEVLDRVTGPWRIPAIVTVDVEEAAAFLASALDAGHEGVMVKAVDSPYDAGRRGSAWRKVKPVKTLDLVVLAAEWGHGRRRGWLSNLHLGARGSDGDFVMVGKTFKGLTDELLTWQTEAFQAIATTQDDWVVHVRPELVVEIALDGVQVSRRYPGGVALRFARVRRYRPDKSPADADTIEAVQALVPGQDASQAVGTVESSPPF